jgi:hypothetical protein
VVVDCRSNGDIRSAYACTSESRIGGSSLTALSHPCCIQLPQGLERPQRWAGTSSWCWRLLLICHTWMDEEAKICPYSVYDNFTLSPVTTDPTRKTKSTEVSGSAFSLMCCQYETGFQNEVLFHILCQDVVVNSHPLLNRIRYIRRVLIICCSIIRFQIVDEA